MLRLLLPFHPFSFVLSDDMTYTVEDGDVAYFDCTAVRSFFIGFSSPLIDGNSTLMAEGLH